MLDSQLIRNEILLQLDSIQHQFLSLLDIATVVVHFTKYKVGEELINFDFIAFYGQLEHFNELIHFIQIQEMCLQHEPKEIEPNDNSV